MIEKMEDGPEGVAALRASGTVLKHDVTEAMRLVGTADRMMVVVAPRFDGYMAELIGGLRQSCEDGQAGRCALVVPEDMRSEADLQGEGGAFRIFTVQAEAERWLGS
ncbi:MULTISPECIES: hypothetical protein [Thioclava]|uniref:hypothetical protein n=1 Tax=Thioclava TaxID=285107 RepID=UPI000B53D316|nr:MULTISPECIES: hypothetical protein [Thioclava]OWY01455.1 hypothetical protein B6V76_14320 [Thioclava sp. IC9]OWY17438.1 hypothetical protein B6V73_07145 [Thioclava sp. JM3]PWE49063.1 hypothetical protein DEM26_14475 [Thioclava sp. NG1]WGT49538.1 hypothetical protein P0N61_14640 [Thioclava nitratireducens]